MLGIDRNTGAAVDDWLQFVQRATRALTTPVGTRQKRPLYGSLIPQLLGQNLGDDLLILAQATPRKRSTTATTASAIFNPKSSSPPAKAPACSCVSPAPGKTANKPSRS